MLLIWGLVIREESVSPLLPLPRRRLGSSDIELSVLGFGGAPLGDLYTRLDDGDAIATVAAAHQAGITLFDTSPHYGHGLSEHRFGTALRRVPREKFVLSTKVGRWMDPRRPRAGESRFVGGFPHRGVFDYSRDGALRAFEQSLIRLGLDRIDVLLIHDVDVWTHGADAIEARFREAMAGAYRALAELREQGVVKAIGIGVNEAEMCERFARAGDFDVMLLAGRYSLLEQPALERFLPLALEKRIGIMLGGVFNSGILATGAVPGARYNYREPPPELLERVARIEAVCRAHGTEIAHVALHFPLGHPAVSTLVLGSVVPDEVRRNVAALGRPVPAGVWADLKSERLLGADVPTPG
jgi:D-threo-aldose 1-dehydrogenase